jgi:hypothetical protein
MVDTISRLRGANVGLCHANPPQAYINPTLDGGVVGYLGG